MSLFSALAVACCESPEFLVVEALSSVSSHAARVKASEEPRSKIANFFNILFNLDIKMLYFLDYHNKLDI
ncbi:hypothetical protein ACFQZ1_15100 [Bacillus sp. CGMCC 1.60114]